MTDNTNAILERLRARSNSDRIHLGAEVPPLELWPTGSVQLDMLIGGWPKGRVVEIFGPEHSGKSTLCANSVREIQRAGKVVIWVDLEQSYTQEYLSAIGVDPTKIIVISDNVIEDAGDALIEVIEDDIEDQHIGMIVWDSIAMGVTLKVDEKSLSDGATVAAEANAYSRMMRKIGGLIGKHGGLSFIMINQLRDNMGAMPFQKQTRTNGGRAIKHQCSVRIETYGKKDVDKANGATLGIDTKVKVIKNKATTTTYEDASIYLPIGDRIDAVKDTYVAVCDYFPDNAQSGRGPFFVDPTSGEKISAQGEKKLLKKLRELSNIQEIMDIYHERLMEYRLEILEGRKSERRLFVVDEEELAKDEDSDIQDAEDSAEAYLEPSEDTSDEDEEAEAESAEEELEELDETDEFIKELREHEVVTKSGAWYYLYDKDDVEVAKAQGNSKLRDMIEDEDNAKIAKKALKAAKK